VSAEISGNQSSNNSNLLAPLFYLGKELFMKKIATYGMSALMALAIVAVSSAGNAANAQNAGLISSILNRMERNRQSLKSLRADITMEKYDSGIKASDRSSGTVLYIPANGRSANVRVDWTRPAQETLSVVGGNYTLFRPRLNMAYQGTKPPKGNGPANSALSLLNMSGSQAKSSFEISLLGEETLWGGVGTSHMKISPKGGATYKFAEIWVDGSGMVVQAKIVDRNDDATTIRLTNVQKNAAVSIDQIKVSLPGDVKIVKT
jgi:outer membrane lipoprotein-sorting protein